MSHIFISYAREDDSFVDQLLSQVKSPKLQFWVDRSQESELVGKPFTEALVEAIESCSVFLLVLSPHAVNSKHVMRELRVADNKNKHILPVVREKCELPADMQYRLTDYHLMDFSNRPHAEVYAALVKALETLVDKYREQSQEPVSSKGQDEDSRGESRVQFRFRKDGSLSPKMVVPRLPVVDDLPALPMALCVVSYGVPDNQLKKAMKAVAAIRRRDPINAMLSEFKDLKQDIDDYSGRAAYLNQLGEATGIRLLARNEKTDVFDRPIQLPMLGQETKRDFSKVDPKFATEYQVREREIEEALVTKRDRMKTLVANLVKARPV